MMPQQEDETWHTRRAWINELSPQDQTDLVLGALVQVVDAAGENYVYVKTQAPEGHPEEFNGPLCWYVKDGKPSCLVGRVLARLGVPVDKLAGTEQVSAAQALQNLGLRLGLGAMGVLGAAQQWQDKGYPWGKALAEARVFLKDPGGYSAFPRGVHITPTP